MSKLLTIERGLQLCKIMSFCTADQLPETAPYGQTNHAVINIQKQLEKDSSILWSSLMITTISKWIRDVEKEALICAEHELTNEFVSFDQKLFKGKYEVPEIMELNRLFLIIGRTILNSKKGKVETLKNDIEKKIHQSELKKAATMTAKRPGKKDAKVMISIEDKETISSNEDEPTTKKTRISKPKVKKNKDEDDNSASSDEEFSFGNAFKQLIKADTSSSNPNNVLVQQELTKQAQEKTKQLELEVKLMEMKTQQNI